MEELNNDILYDYLFNCKVKGMNYDVLVKEVEGYDRAIDNIVLYINSRNIGTLYKILNLKKRATRNYVKKRFTLIHYVRSGTSWGKR